METPAALKNLGIQYDPNFNFDKETHKYTWEGREMTGTTTILKGVKNPDALLGWAAGCAVDALLSGASPEEARKAHVTKRDARKDDGTSTHELVEIWIKRMIESNGGMPIAEVGNPIYEFQRWAVSNDIVFLGSEMPVYYREGFVGGIIDFIFEKDGKLYLGDLKTNKTPKYGSGIYYSYWMQLASYRNAIESMGRLNREIEGYAVCRMSHATPTSPDFEVKFRENYPADRRAFLGALEIYRSTKDYESAK